MRIIKRSGNEVEFDLAKWQAHIAMVCKDISGVSPSMVEIFAQPSFRDGMTTKELDELALRSMVDLIDEETHPDIGNVNYQYAAAKQRLTMLRKDMFGSYEVPRLYDIVKKNVALNLYTPELLNWYTEEEWDKMERFVDHERDEEYTFAALEQFVDKYLVQDRTIKMPVETPQIRYIIIAATAFHMENPKIRMQRVKEAYNAASEGAFTLATPVLAGLGTPTKQFSSCVLVKTGDSLDSIYASGTVIGKYAAKRAGIGFEMGRLRPAGAKIRGGEVAHTGIIPFIKKWYHDIAATSQGGIRKGSMTFYAPIWHAQIMDYLVLKDNKGTEDSRARHADYGVVMSKYFWNRYLKKKDMTLFDPNSVPDLYEAFYRDPTGEFIKLYEKYEKDPKIKSEKVSTVELLNLYILQRSDTGRYYPMFVDNVSTQGPFDTLTDPIYQSNLCVAPDTKLNVAMHFPNCMGATHGTITISKLTDLINNFGVAAYVLSKNIQTGVVTQEKILAAAKTDTNRVLYKITHNASGESVRVTGNHKVWTENRGYVVAALLKEDDELSVWTANTFIEDTGITIEIEKELSDVYDITVEDNHNFYGGGILVHNCAEIALPTASFESVDDENGRVALCTLGSNNWGAHKHPEDLRKSCHILVRLLHNVLGYQDYVSIQSKLATEDFEPLGIGITNLAYWMAKRKFKYGEPDALAEVKLWMEHQAFYLTEASVELAREKGPCKRSDHTWYGKGVFPWERRAKGVNTLTDFTPSTDLDWEGLRAKMLKYGIRNATLMATAPVESSSVVLNSTNGINLVKNLISVKGSKANRVIQVVPEYNKLKKHYEILWDQPSPRPYLKTAAIIQAFGDQSISTDTYYNGSKFRTDNPETDGKVPMDLVVEDHILVQYWGLKTLYYDLKNKEASKEIRQQVEESKKNEEQIIEDDCEACKL